jgi:hypothetical protein
MPSGLVRIAAGKTGARHSLAIPLEWVERWNLRDKRLPDTMHEDTRPSGGRHGHPRHAALNRGEHLLLQQADLLLAVGMLDPGAAQRLAGMTPQDSFNRLLGGLQQQEWILLG